MSDSFIIALKEFSDNIVSRRFMILLTLLSALAILSSFAIVGHAYQALPFSDILVLGSISIVRLIGDVGPLLGIALSFDAINKEKETGSIMLLLSCPIYRDSVLTGKFLGGLLTISLSVVSMIMLLLGFTIAQLGIMPSKEEAIRLAIYMVISIIYVSCYMALSLLTSTLTEKSSTSLLISISIWIFSTFLIPIIASAMASLIPSEQVEIKLKTITLIYMLSLNRHYDTLSKNIISPHYFTDPFSILPRWSMSKKLDLMESLSLSWPNLAVIIAVTVIFLAVAYIKFLREEVR